MNEERLAEVVVIGAGQAGLSAANHLQRRGFVPADDAGQGADRDGGSAAVPLSYVVFDAEDGPGVAGATAGKAC